MADTNRPGCKTPGCILPARRIGKSKKTGKIWYRSLCASCGCGPYQKPYRIYKELACSKCGYDKCQAALEVHHIDGDHGNNDPSNLITLCANHHREAHHLLD